MNDSGAANEPSPDTPVRLDVDSAVQGHSVHELRLGLRSYFSSDWLRAAMEFRDEAERVERAHQGRSTFNPHHRVLVIASVQAAVAFMEAVVNELYQDAAHGNGLTNEGYVAPLPEATRWSMAEVWQGTAEGRRVDTLSKYQLMLTSAGLRGMTHGENPYQDAKLATRLRNALVHYQPETVYPDESHRLEQQLRGKFSDNRLMTGSGNAWWPSHCLGAGCAGWAVDSVRAVTDGVTDRLSIEPNYVRLGL